MVGNSTPVVLLHSYNVVRATRGISIKGDKIQKEKCCKIGPCGMLWVENGNTFSGGCKNGVLKSFAFLLG